MAHLLHHKDLTFDVERLRTRIRYGIKEELLDLVQLKGVGRIRARHLYAHGFKTLSDLKFTTVEELGKIRQIGKTLAADIVTQITQTKNPQKLETMGSAY